MADINLNLGGAVGTKPIWVTKSKLKKIRPIRSRHYEDMADGYFTVKRDLSDPLRDKVDYQIPKDAGSYSTVTSIKDIDLPIGAAQLFARMVAEEKGSSSKSSRSRDSYEDDLMFHMAKLDDDYPEIPQTRENAERLLWKMPLLKQPSPSQPTRKGLMLGD